jgi:hypothetical protein
VILKVRFMAPSPKDGVKMAQGLLPRCRHF